MRFHGLAAAGGEGLEVGLGSRRWRIRVLGARGRGREGGEGAVRHRCGALCGRGLLEGQPLVAAPLLRTRVAKLQ